ncbi:hypothetical protein HFP89_13305 [Wenzhouxiangella sp. XN79A]|nr:hypothetical protein [Wenzhouxiangella sp. XN79A]
MASVVGFGDGALREIVRRFGARRAIDLVRRRIDGEEPETRPWPARSGVDDSNDRQDEPSVSPSSWWW